MSKLENSISLRYATAPAPPPQTCSLRISKQLVEKVLLMRIFHLCSVRVFRAEIRDETQSMRSEKLFIKRSKQYTFWHNITTTSPTLDQKTNQTPALLFSRHASVTKICLCEPGCQQNHTRGDGICCSITPAAAHSIARAVTLACGETRDGSKNYEEWERKGII